MSLREEILRLGAHETSAVALVDVLASSLEIDKRRNGAGSGCQLPTMIEKLNLKAIVVSSLLLTSAPCVAQILDSSKSIADFSGTWKLDRNASTDSRTLSRFDEVTLAISQNGSTLNVSYSGNLSRHCLKTFNLRGA